MKTIGLLLITMILSCSISFAQTEKEKSKMHKQFIKRFSKYIFIPSGTYHKSQNQDDKISLRTFYMTQTEVTNLQWREFIADMESKVSKDSLLSLIPDTTLWSDLDKKFNNSFENFYYRHPAYDDYPVVGISYNQTQVFCKWLTQRLNTDGISPYKKVVVSLPLESEWEYAATGGNIEAIYPWDGFSFIDKETGAFKANFQYVTQDKIKSNNSGNLELAENPTYSRLDRKTEGPIIKLPTKVYTFKPNGFGLYNMGGNVAEMIQESGILKGGSFQSPGSNLNLYYKEKYSDPNFKSVTQGFRIVVRIVEY